MQQNGTRFTERTYRIYVLNVRLPTGLGVRKGSVTEFLLLFLPLMSTLNAKVTRRHLPNTGGNLLIDFELSFPGLSLETVYTEIFFWACSVVHSYVSLGQPESSLAGFMVSFRAPE